MAHEITSTDTAMFVKQAAWHGLGTVVPDTMSAGDGLRFIGMDWEVNSAPIALQETGREIASHRAQVRSDNNAILGIVSSGYSTVQNSSLAAIADAMAGEGGCKVESMGSLRGGRRVWILARAESYDVMPGDEHVPYVCLCNGHDGSLSLRVLPTAVRVVCANTLSMALGHGGNVGYTFRHTSGLSVRLDEVREALARFRDNSDRTRERSKWLASHKLTREQVQDLWLNALTLADGPINPTPETEGEQRRYNRAFAAMAHMSETFDREARTYGDNAYTAVNAATQWLQHERGRLAGDARAASRLFGDYARYTARTFANAEEMVGAV